MGNSCCVDTTVILSPAPPRTPEPLMAIAIRHPPPPDYHDMVPTLPAIELASMIRPLPSSLLKENEEKVIHGHLTATWAAVDDRRLFIRSHFLRSSNLIEDAIYIIIEYVGCLVCPDPKATEYRLSKLNPEAKSLELLCCVTDKRRATCRYCGLYWIHHFNNRELQPCPGYTQTGENFPSMSFYCRMRCPIHGCLNCKQPFVKMSQAHLCASCLVECRTRPKNHPQLRWQTTETENPYADEIKLYVELARATRVQVRTVSGKYGTNKVVETVACIDGPESTRRIREFLDRTEYTCTICSERFRLAYMLPASVPSATTASTIQYVCGFCTSL